MAEQAERWAEQNCPLTANNEYQGSRRCESQLPPRSGRSLLIHPDIWAGDDVIEKLMRYSDALEMMVGDEVLADGMSGVIVCDFKIAGSLRVTKNGSSHC